MLVYPQLETGALVQFPFYTEHETRSVLQQFPDGSVQTWSDPAATTLCWRLSYRDLSDMEMRALSALHSAAQGRLRSFLFLDPSANLLAWSDDLQRPVWEASPLLRIEAAGATVTRLINESQTEQTLGQTVPVPSGFTYAFSCDVRSSTPSRVQLERLAGTVLLRTEGHADSAWKRLVQTGALPAEGNAIEFRLAIAPGAVVEVRGLQVEAQPCASDYKASYEQTGAYPHARFASDELRVVSRGTDRHDIQVEVLTKVS